MASAPDDYTFSCDICTEDFRNDIHKDICTIQCGHVYHKKCLKTIFQAQNRRNSSSNCPSCHEPPGFMISLFLFGNNSSTRAITNTDGYTFSCGICGNGFLENVNSNICALLCGHVYHDNCLKTISKSQRQQNNSTKCRICGATGRCIIPLLLFGNVSITTENPIDGVNQRSPGAVDVNDSGFIDQSRVFLSRDSNGTQANGSRATDSRSSNINTEVNYNGSFQRSNDGTSPTHDSTPPNPGLILPLAQAIQPSPEDEDDGRIETSIAEAIKQAKTLSSKMRRLRQDFQSMHIRFHADHMATQFQKLRVNILTEDM